MPRGFSFLKGHNVCTEASYSYNAHDGSCKLPCSDVAIPRGGVTGYKTVADEDGLLSAIQNQPVSVAIEADQSSFQLYHSGVLTATCGKKLDHGVLLVGYGTDGSKDYWKVKNSWGSSWGEAGYIRIERGTDKCGIGDSASYPVVDGSAPPSPTPPSPPGPSPPGPPSGCADKQDKFYCDFAKQQNFCKDLWADCKKTCGCCDADPPGYCSGPGPSPGPSPPSPPSACSAGCQEACQSHFGGPCCSQSGDQCSCCRAGQSCSGSGGCSGGDDCNKVDLSINGSSIVV